jgi:hypothetical protein
MIREAFILTAQKVKLLEKLDSSISLYNLQKSMVLNGDKQ